MNSHIDKIRLPGAEPQGTPVAAGVSDSGAPEGPLSATGVLPALGAPRGDAGSEIQPTSLQPISNNNSNSNSQHTILNIFQLNANKSRPPHQLLLSHAAGANTGVTSTEDNYFVALIQEPNCVKGKIMGYKGLVNFKADSNDRVRSCIYISKTLNTTKYNQFTNTDMTTIGVKLENKTIIICSLYLPPYEEDPIEPIFTNLIDFCSKERLDLIIGTDANAHHIAWGCKDINTRGENLMEFIINKNLNVINVGNTPTFSNRIRNTIIDLTLTNNLSYSSISNWKVLDQDSLSDHSTISYEVRLQDTTAEDQYRNIRRLRTRQFKQGLEETFNPHFSGNIHVKTKYLTDCIVEAYHKSTPLSRGVKTGSLNWGRDIIKAKNRVNRLRKMLKRGENANTREEYRKAKITVHKLVKKKRRADWRKFCKKIENTGESSRIIKMLKGNNIVGNCTLEKPDGTFTNDPQETLQLLYDKHFPTLNGENDNIVLTEASPTTEILDFIDIHTIREAIFSFKKYKSPGADGIFPILLQEGFETIGEYLLDIYKESLITNTIPYSWTVSRVVFIPKPGKFRYTTPKDFRPLSLTSFLLKGLEKLILWFIEERFLSPNLNKNLFAYQQGKSTETALHAVVHKLEKSLIKKECSILICLDIDSAFSMATPQSMVEELSRTGCEEIICEWIRNLLTDRQITSTWGATPPTGTSIEALLKGASFLQYFSILL